MSEIEQRMRELRRELRGISRRRRRRVLAEARDHLSCALDDGLSEAEAVACLGRPDVAFAGFPARRRPRLLAIAIGPVALLALTPSLDGTVLRLGGGTTPSEAAQPGVVTQSQGAAALRRCVSAWNGDASARWRSAATQAGIERAYVTLTEAAKEQPGTHTWTNRIVGCLVSLRPAPVASPYQPVIRVSARPAGETFRFDRLVRGQTRTAAPAVNARVDASGRLALSDRRLPAICPAGAIGSEVVRVEALPSGRALRSGATTQLPAGPRTTYVVAIRNVGSAAIHGAVVSLDVGGEARSNPWWRSGPRVVQRLDPGVTTSLRFAAPAFGHGVRLIRATTAAIACETRIADNSPVFRVDLG